jgi:hypothetical protein
MIQQPHLPQPADIAQELELLLQKKYSNEYIAPDTLVL